MDMIHPGLENSSIGSLEFGLRAKSQEEDHNMVMLAEYSNLARCAYQQIHQLTKIHPRSGVYVNKLHLGSLTLVL